MGGAACIIIIHAVVRYDSVPKTYPEQRELESQLRTCYSNPTIAEAVASTTQAQTMWDILAKPGAMSEADMTTLMSGLDGIYT